MHFTGIHPPVLAEPAYAICARALFAGACDFVGGAQVKLEEDIAACSWTLRVSW